jgi:hypothetical protein
MSWNSQHSRQKRQKTYHQDNSIGDTKTRNFRIQRFFENGPHNYTYYAIPLGKNGNPAGKSIRLKFNNLYSPKSHAFYKLPTSKNITCTYKTTNSVLSWRFTETDAHNRAMTIEEYKLTYKYRLKAKAINAFKDYNEAIKSSGWATRYIQPVNLGKIKHDPWFLIEWEDKIQDIGLSKDSKKHFNLTQCDAIGVAFNLDPNTISRTLQYCVASIDQLCHSKGSTLVYQNYFIKNATQNINQSEMNKLKRITVSPTAIKKISEDRDDYFFVGRTDMHNMKLFISSKELWKAQNFIIQTVYNLLQPMNTPFYQERELIINCVKGKFNNTISFDLISNIISSKLWFKYETEKHIQRFMRYAGMKAIDNIQRKSIHASINEPVSIVSGGPGRGKSSCVLRGILYVIDQLYSVCYKSLILDEYILYGLRDRDVTLTSKSDSDYAKDVVRAFHDMQLPSPVCVHVLSFTGKAVSRIKELLHPKNLYVKFEPMTIHRLFARCSQFKWLREFPTILIIDEVSMVSDMLFYKLIKRFKNIKKIILLGDFDQLPPIQPGDLLQELIASRCVPVTRLVKNYRQGAGSELPDIADKIIGRETKGSESSRIYGGWDHALNIPTQKNKSDIYDLDSIFGDSHDCKVFGYGNHVTEDKIFKDIAKQVASIGYENGIDLFIECVVLAAKRVEVAKLNSILQTVFMENRGCDPKNGKGLKSYFEGIEFNFVPGDRVMHLENNYDINIFNGDVGRVTNIDFRSKTLDLKLEDDIDIKTVHLENTMPAYSQTVHKVQGSEYNIVVIYISDQASMLHVDQWLYTAFTRAKKKVYIFGYTNEIISTISKELQYRRTFLKHRMQLEFSHDLNDLVKDELTNLPK